MCKKDRENIIDDYYQKEYGKNMTDEQKKI